MPRTDEEDTKQPDPKRRRKNNGSSTPGTGGSSGRSSSSSSTSSSSSSTKSSPSKTPKHLRTPDSQTSSKKKSSIPRHRRISDTLVRLSSGRRRKRSLGMTNDIPAENSEDRTQVFGERCVADIKRCNQRLDHVLRSYQPGAKFSELDRLRREVALVAGQNETLTKQLDALEKSKKEQTGKLRDQLEAERRLASRDKERLDNELSALNEQFDQNESKNNELRNQIDDKDAKINELQKLIEELELKNAALERQNEALNTEMKLYMNKLQDLESLLDRSADQHRMDLEAEQKKYGELLKEKEQAVRETYDDALAKKQRGFQDRMDELETMNERLKKKAEKLAKEKNDLGKDMGHLTEAMNNLRQNLEKQTLDGESVELADLKKDNEELKRQLDKQDREMAQMQVSYKAMANESADSKDEILRLKTHVRRLEEKLAPHLYASPSRRLLFEQRKPLIFDTVSTMTQRDGRSGNSSSSSSSSSTMNTPLTLSKAADRNGNGIVFGSHSKLLSGKKGSDGTDESDGNGVPVRLVDVSYDSKNDSIIFALENFSLYEVEFTGIYLETDQLGLDRHMLHGLTLKPSEKKRVCIGGHVKDASHWPVADEARKNGLTSVNIFICDKFGGSVFMESIPLDMPDSHEDGVPGPITIRSVSSKSTSSPMTTPLNTNNSSSGSSHGKSRFSKGKSQRKRG